MTDAPRVTPDQIAEADRRLVRTVDGFSDDDLAAPSLLPGWSRAHVVAHLALNGEGLARVLTGQRRGTPQPMYDSPEARDTDIEELAGSDAAGLRERFLKATKEFEQAVAAMTVDAESAHFERTPGGPSFRVGNVPLMRVREVEIHHADLGASYSHLDWSDDFSAVLVESMTKRPYAEPFRVQARDLDRAWQLGDGEGGTVVAGDAAALGWWLTGRGDGEGVESDSGTLPEVGAW